MNHISTDAGSVEDVELHGRGSLQSYLHRHRVGGARASYNQNSCRDWSRNRTRD